MPLPMFIREKQLNDLSAFTKEAILNSTKLNAQFGTIIEHLVKEVAKVSEESTR